MAKLLGISKSMVRKYCVQNRMPGAKKIDGEWMIPANLDKPEAEPSSPVKAEKLPPLARKVKSQKKRNNFHGLYDYIQINSSYSSSRMASKRNIHFYVNRCGFHIVEFFNEKHPDPHAPRAARMRTLTGCSDLRR